LAKKWPARRSLGEKMACQTEPWRKNGLPDGALAKKWPARRSLGEKWPARRSLGEVWWRGQDSNLDLILKMISPVSPLPRIPACLLSRLPSPLLSFQLVPGTHSIKIAENCLGLA